MKMIFIVYKQFRHMAAPRDQKIIDEEHNGSRMDTRMLDLQKIQEEQRKRESGPEEIYFSILYCEACGLNQMKDVGVQTRSADEGETPFYMCMNKKCNEYEKVHRL